jgi:hypothetical protein
MSPIVQINFTANDILIKRLMSSSNYDKNIVPVDPHTGLPINVTVDFWPYDILYVVR